MKLPSNQVLLEAAAIICNGGVVAIPTETVYGLAADAMNIAAVARIFEIKGRPRFDPLIVHLSRAEDLTGHPLGSLIGIDSPPPPALRLIEAFWKPAGGPLTLVLPKSDLIPDLVTAGLPSAAFRVPHHPVARDLISMAGRPLAAPSANRFGSVSPTTAQHVLESLGEGGPMSPDLIIDGGPCSEGVESTVISFVDADAGTPVLLRPGALPMEEIERLIGPVIRPGRLGSIDRPDPRTSPGMLRSHYATSAPMSLIRENDPLTPSLPPAIRRPALLAFRSAPAPPHPYITVEVLSPTGSLREAATNLFAALRRLDTAKPDLIIAQLVPESGLGMAINDRLRRAAAPRTLFTG